MAYTYSQVLQMVHNAGFTGVSAYTMAAISYAESAFNPLATNHNNDSVGSIDRGIAQINSYWHPEVPDSCAYNPQCAFKAAYTISHKGSDFTAWSTYNSGKYKAFMNGPPTSSSNGSGLGSLPGDIASGAGSVASGVGNIAGGLANQVPGVQGAENIANTASAISSLPSNLVSGAFQLGRTALPYIAIGGAIIIVASILVKDLGENGI